MRRGMSGSRNGGEGHLANHGFHSFGVETDRFGLLACKKGMAVSGLVFLLSVLFYVLVSAAQNTPSILFLEAR